jgi:hypothetical protein
MSAIGRFQDRATQRGWAIAFSGGTPTRIVSASKPGRKGTAVLTAHFSASGQMLTLTLNGTDLTRLPVIRATSKLVRAFQVLDRHPDDLIAWCES